MNNEKKKSLGATLLGCGIGGLIAAFTGAAKADKAFRGYYLSSSDENLIMSILILCTIAGSACIIAGVWLLISAKLGEKNESLLGKNRQSMSNPSASTVCPACGLELTDKDDVCPNCGAKLAHRDSVDIVQLIKKAENNGKRTAIAIPISGNMVSIQEKVNQYLQAQNYARVQTSNGELVWMNGSQLIKYDFVPGYVILSGCLSINGDESNLNGMYGAILKRSITNHMSEIRKLVE